MTTPAQTLTEAILAKCQRNRWFGPDYYSPRRYDGFFTSDFNPFPDEEGNFPAPTIDAARDYSPIPLDAPERAGFAYVQATPTQIASSEQMLGFVLPSVLRNLYQGLANGGFGPVTGLRGIKGGYNGANHEGTIIDIYPTTANPDQLFDLAPNQQGWLVLPEGRWPREVWRRVARCPSISLCICSRSVDHAQDVSLFEINKKIHASAFKAEAPDP